MCLPLKKYVIIGEKNESYITVGDIKPDVS